MPKSLPSAQKKIQLQTKLVSVPKCIIGYNLQSKEQTVHEWVQNL